MIDYRHILFGLMVIGILLFIFWIPILVWKSSLPSVDEFGKFNDLSCIQTDKENDCNDYDMKKRSYFYIRKPEKKWLCCNRL